MLLAALTAAGCSSADGTGDEETRLAGSTWQVTDIYLVAGEPSALPVSAQGLAQLYFGASTLTGYTGCTGLQGEVTFSDDTGAPADPEQATRLTFDSLAADSEELDCDPAQRLVHDELLELLHGPFGITRPSSFEVVLTQAGDGVDRPSLRLATG